ncbi:uncharacterized protein BDV14DRAFT_166487 [Aspergillus stella-maris]|uniref:uncharacterized protein n=1 Tax=Aspergillus stella-maris TaxID=1810926 RepID=UPI003CCCDEDE
MAHNSDSGRTWNIDSSQQTPAIAWPNAATTFPVLVVVVASPSLCRYPRAYVGPILSFHRASYETNPIRLCFTLVYSCLQRLRIIHPNVPTGFESDVPLHEYPRNFFLTSGSVVFACRWQQEGE